MKLIRPEIAVDKNTIERFRNELKIARDVSHKNICRMYDLGREAGNYFLTMEYVSGEDLKNMIRMSGQLGVGTAVSIAKQVCEGLAEAHRRGTIHRDLKPSNIMIDREGTVRIMDFGIARSIHVKGITGGGVMIGTPEYMSPEQVEGKEIDQRTDIYSLGIILYEMLTGHVPFEGDTPFTVGVKHKSEIPKSPRELNAHIPEDLNRLVLKCLEKDKNKRYQNADELRIELEKIEKGIPTTERTIPKHKPFTSKEITVKFTVRKFMVPVLAAIVVIIGGLVAWRLLSRENTVPIPTDKPSLAVVYFDNISEDPSLNDWIVGLPNLITTDLLQSRFLNVVDADQIYGILKKLNLLEAKKYSIADLANVAKEGRVQHVLSGSLMKAGPKIIITVRLHKPGTGDLVELVGTKKIECNGEDDIPAKVDELTRMIKSDLNLTPGQISSDIDKTVGQITTNSPEAYKYYTEARKLHLETDNRNAIMLYEKAVALDPGFAMAYRAMASCYGNLKNVQKEREFSQKALEFIDRVSDRERLLIQGTSYMQSERTYDKATKAFEQLLKHYPDDTIALAYLGIIHGRLEEDSKAEILYEKCYQIEKSANGAENLAANNQGQGRYDKAQRVFEDFLRTVSDAPAIHVLLGYSLLYQARYEEALSEAEKAFLLSPGLTALYYLKGVVHHLQGNFAAAEKEWRTVLEKADKSSQIPPRERLAALYLAQGRLGKAREEIEQALILGDELKNFKSRADTATYGAYIDCRSGHPDKAIERAAGALKVYRDIDLLPEQRSALTRLGFAYLELGSVDQAAKTAGELKELIQISLNRKAVRYYHLLEGHIELKKGNYAKAVENFEKAESLLRYQRYYGHPREMSDEHALFMDPLAAAYEKSGNIAKAREEYEKITTLTSGRFMFPDIYVKAFYNIGKIAEKQGDKVKARENYQKFLNFWKDADPGISEVEDAKKRLAALQVP